MVKTLIAGDYQQVYQLAQSRKFGDVMGRLEKKVSFITGAGSGIGKATAEKFATEGSCVVVQDLNLASAQDVVENLGGSEHLALGGDVSDEKEMVNAFLEVSNKYGKLDVLVNNAGVSDLPDDGFKEVKEGKGPQIRHMSYGSFMKMLAIHAGGTFLCTQSAVPLMKDGGSIINLSSIAGLAGWGPIHYSSAKGAILSFTRAAARELGGLDIRINAVAPGVVETPMIKDLEKSMLDPLVMMSPLGRIGKAEEIASTILYLACSESSFVTGQWISPNGGLITS